MALKIRLRQQGRKNRPFFRLVLTESRAPRDGKYLEMLGWYNPLEADAEKNVNVQADRVTHWLDLGAVITEKAAALLKRTCPQVIEMYRQRELAKKAKACEKRRLAKKEGGKEVKKAEKKEMKKDVKAAPKKKEKAK